MMQIVHHHLIYQANIKKESSILSCDESELRRFLLALIEDIGMEILIQPVFKFSKQKAWTGLVGIVTSHISFHFWTMERYVQLDIYSCKKFDREKAVNFLNQFWTATSNKVLFLIRNHDQNFEIENYDNLGILNGKN